jgi:hypothetical protein
MPPSIDQIIDRLDSYPLGTTFNVKEIATILELPNDTVAARLNRDKETYKPYLSRKKAGVGGTYEYRLDREAIMNMVNDPRYRGSYRINNLKPKKQEPHLKIICQVLKFSYRKTHRRIGRLICQPWVG